MNHNTIELPKSYYDNPQEYKTKIKNWIGKVVVLFMMIGMICMKYI